MKNDGTRHDWQMAGGYDPALDGPDPQWGRQQITCRICGERRRIFTTVTNPAVAYGCRRDGSDTWQNGDLLIRNGSCLDRFVAWLPDGMVRTFNAGGHYHDSDPSALYPA